jgi:hypothetical protein
MPAPASIASDMTARQVAAAWPRCALVLEQCPGAKVEGRWSLQEIGYLARACGRDPTAFLEELAEAAGAAMRAPGPASPRGGSPIPLIFTSIAICLTLGGGWGVWMLLRIAGAINYQAVSAPDIHVHGVAQLWGWMALFIFAVATHLLGQTAKRRAPVWLHYAAAAAIVAALPLFFARLWPGVRQAMAGADIVASALLMFAAICFGVSALASLRGQSRQVWHRFVLILIGWLWIWSAVDLLIRIRSIHLAIPSDAARNLLIILPVLGFATNAIYGFGIRLIPGLLTISNLRPRCFAATFILHNLGLCLLLIPLGPTEVLGPLLMLAAAIVYLAGMNFLHGKPPRAIYGVDLRGHILIRAAFFWLVVGLLMIVLQPLLPTLPHAYAGAWRHALTVGFITTMILGVGQRLVPIFIKQPLFSTRLMLVSAAFILVGSAGRVTLELATIGHWSWAFHWMGLTGLLELTAIGLFAFNLLATVRNRRHVYRPGELLTPDVRVREAVNVYPALQTRLRQLGVDMFDKTLFIAPSLTFGALALGEGRTPEQFLTELGFSDEFRQAPTPCGP